MPFQCVSIWLFLKVFQVISTVYCVIAIILMPLHIFQGRNSIAFKKPDAKTWNIFHVPCAAGAWFEAVSSSCPRVITFPGPLFILITQPGVSSEARVINPNPPWRPVLSSQRERISPSIPASGS